MIIIFVGTKNAWSVFLLTEYGYLSTNDYNDLVEELAKVENAAAQHWARSAADDEGFFTLKDTKFGKFLYGHEKDKLTIEGISYVHVKKLNLKKL